MLSNYSINKKAIDFFKKNGKNIVCSTLAAVALMVPCKAKLESRNEEVVSATKIEDTFNMQEIVFVVKTEWQKTKDYSDGKGPVKANREYERIVSKYRVTENFNEEYFNDDYQKVLETIRDDENIEKIFELIEEKKEVINVTENEEKKLDKKNWNLEVEGTDIKASIINPTLNFDIQNERAMILFFGIFAVPLIVMAILTDFRPKRKR